MITYKNSSNVSYIDMCKWLDTCVNAHKIFDEDRAYKYLYHLYTMFALKYKWFNNEDDVDKFALLSAERTFLRMISKKSEPPKSILNYIKSTAYPYKVRYQQEEYYHGNIPKFEQLSIEEIEDTVEYTDAFDIKTAVGRAGCGLSLVEVKAYLEDVDRTIKDYVYSNAIYRDNTERDNIYISCLLTYINHILLPNVKKKRYENVLVTKLDLLLDTAQKQSNTEVVLYHLDNSYKDVILALVREIKKLLSDDITEIMKDDVPYVSGGYLWKSQNDYS